MATKEIHFYEAMNVIPKDCNVLLDWESINNALKKENSLEIHTTQMCMLSTTWLIKNYRMFVHQSNGNTYEIVLRNHNNTGVNTVRISQNVYAMWAANIFRK